MDFPILSMSVLFGMGLKGEDIGFGVLATMTSEEFNTWLADMKHTYGIARDRRIAQMLCVSDDTFTRYKQRGCSKMAALSCKALLHNLGPKG